MGVPLHAAPSLPDSDPVAARGVLRVATPGDYAPYALRGPSTEALRGVDVELALEIAADLGLGVEWVTTRWASLLDDAGSGRFDLAVGGISRTPERAKAFTFARVLMRDQKSPLSRCGEERRFDTLGEINRPGVRVIVNPGGTNEQFARSRFPHAQLRVHPDNLTVFDEIAGGSADVMVTDQVEARLRARQQRGLCAVRVRSQWAPMQKAYMVIGSPALKAAIDDALGRALRRESYARRLAAWIDSPWPDAAQPASLQLAMLVDARLTVVIEVARWKWNRKAAIEDLPRERSLLEGLRTAAASRGLPTTMVNEFFEAQIEAAKQLQRDLFLQWKKQSAGNFAGVADLDQVLRPRIDQLNAAMLEALGRWDGQAVARERLGRLRVEGLSPRATTIALRPLGPRPGT